MPTPTFSKLDPAASREVAAKMAREVARAKQQPRFTNFQFAISLVIVAIAFAVFTYLMLW